MQNPASSDVTALDVGGAQICESGIYMSRDKSIKPWSSVEAVQSQQMVGFSSLNMCTRLPSACSSSSRLELFSNPLPPSTYTPTK